jgi:5-methylcytosine-specific restriction endonuclease McrA
MFRRRKKVKRKPGSAKRMWMAGERHCKYCGRKLRLSEATCDHVKPLAKGGYDKRRNLVVACAPCNYSKGSEWVDRFLNRKREELTASTEPKGE